MRHLSRPSLPLFQQPRARLQRWKEIGASSAVLSWLAHGVPVELRGDGARPPPIRRKSAALEPAQAVWWLKERQRLQASGAIRLDVGGTATHIHQAFLVPKPQKGDYRVVVNLRYINSFCQPHSTRYESLKLLQRMPMQDKWLIAFDIKDAYHHVAVREADQPMLAFDLEGQTFICQALPFGWLDSPYFFTKVMRPLVAHLRQPRPQPHTSPLCPPSSVTATLSPPPPLAGATAAAEATPAQLPPACSPTSTTFWSSQAPSSMQRPWRPGCETASCLPWASPCTPPSARGCPPSACSTSA